MQTEMRVFVIFGKHVAIAISDREYPKTFVATQQFTPHCKISLDKTG